MAEAARYDRGGGAEAARWPGDGQAARGLGAGRDAASEKLPLEQAKHAKAKLWLLRLPPRVAQLWADAPAGADLGELEIQPGDKLTVELAGDGRGGPVRAIRRTTAHGERRASGATCVRASGRRRRRRHRGRGGGRREPPPAGCAAMSSRATRSSHSSARTRSGACAACGCAASIKAHRAGLRPRRRRRGRGRGRGRRRRRGERRDRVPSRGARFGTKADAMAERRRQRAVAAAAWQRGRRRGRRRGGRAAADVRTRLRSSSGCCSICSSAIST